MTCTPPLTAVAAFLSAVCVSSAAAHSGGLNREGCHNNRKTGDYHCHGGGAASRPSAAASMHAPPDDEAGAASGPYRNCAAARAAGAAPVRVGEPGYGPHLDRDGDGIGCEPYRGR
jgi:hypothetical protein